MNDRISVRLTKDTLWIKEAIKEKMKKRSRSENFLVVEALVKAFAK